MWGCRLGSFWGGATMNPEQARDVLLAATWEDLGAFTLLRFGQDPGSGRMLELRVALRVLWRHWHSRDALPFDIAGAAAMLLHFRGECVQNLRATGVVRERLLDFELPDVVQGAFELLSGPDAASWVVPRPDLERLR
jgi:hypothetical protein